MQHLRDLKVRPFCTKYLDMNAIAYIFTEQMYDCQNIYKRPAYRLVTFYYNNNKMSVSLQVR